MHASARLWLRSARPAVFVSGYGMAESVDRLRAATCSGWAGAMSRQVALGRVDERKVVLRRVIPLVRNGFKPAFVGRFVQGEQGVRLEGRFGMPRLTKAFLVAWFGFCVVWVAVATGAALFSDHGKPLLPLFGIAMLGAGALVVLLGRWLARHDIAWLSRVIESALGGADAD